MVPKRSIFRCIPHQTQNNTQLTTTLYLTCSSYYKGNSQIGPKRNWHFLASTLQLSPSDSDVSFSYVIANKFEVSTKCYSDVIGIQYCPHNENQSIIGL